MGKSRTSRVLEVRYSGRHCLHHTQGLEPIKPTLEQLRGSSGMSQWMLKCTLHKALGAGAAGGLGSSTASGSQSAVAKLAARRYSLSSVPDRRKRNHFQSNKKDQKKNSHATDKTSDDTAPVVAGRFGNANANAQSNTRAKGNWDLFSSTSVNRIGSNANSNGSNAVASTEAGAANAQQSGKSAFRNAKARAGNFKKKQGDAKQSPVFTNKFQNLLSFAFDDGNDTNSAAEESTSSRSSRNLLDQDDDDVFSSKSAKTAVDLSALGFDDEVDDDVDEDDSHFKKHKNKTAKIKFDAAAPSSPSGALLSAAPSAAGGSPDKRKQLKNKKKKDGRSLLKNFQFENSIFDSEDDIFGHVDWDEKCNDAENRENREQRRFQRTMRKQTKQAPVKIVAAPLEVEIPTSISVKDLAERMCIKSKVLIKALKDLGERGMKDESVLSNDIAELAVESLNMVPILLPPDFVDLELTMPPADCSMFPPRSPIISVMGHVDHGKTTLLDSLRKSKVAAAEAGGITQSIGAFTVELGKKFGNQSKITFIDTPGHAAFSNMRSRGSEVTDIIVLVVAADDGVRPQTVEVIQLAQKNNVPMVVAVTKCDMHSHDEEEVRNRIADQLLNRGVVVEQMGGDTPLVCVSGKTGEGIDTLKETIALHAEILDLRADDKATGEAVVLEANVARGVGTQVDAIVKWGTLKTGTIVVCGLEYGKIRALVDQAGKRVKQISPGNPARVIGLKGLPNAGDALLAVDTEERAKEVIAQRQELLEWDVMATAEEDEDDASGNGTHRRRKYMGARRKWEQIELRRRQEVDEAKRIASLKAGDEGYVANIVPIIVKTDSVGVISAIDELIASLPSDEAIIKRILASVGPVSSSDVAMAEATGATIYAFNIKHPSTIDREALEKNVSIRQHRVVYTMLDDIKELLRDNLSGVEETEIIGSAEVIQSIPITKSGRRTTNIAGCKITMGLMNMQAKYRLIRDGETIVEDVGMESMRHFQEKVGEVTKGQECGLLLDGIDDFQPGDILQAYVVKVVKQAL
ncbi:Translation initiation factor if-2, partial [Globisporangium splendens]